MYRHHTFPPPGRRLPPTGRAEPSVPQIGRHRRGCDAPFVLAPDGLLTPIVLADQEQHGADVAYALSGLLAGDR